MHCVVYLITQCISNFLKASNEPVYHPRVRSWDKVDLRGTTQKTRTKFISILYGFIVELVCVHLRESQAIQITRRHIYVLLYETPRWNSHCAKMYQYFFMEPYQIFYKNIFNANWHKYTHNAQTCVCSLVRDNRKKKTSWNLFLYFVQVSGIKYMDSSVASTSHTDLINV